MSRQMTIQEIKENINEMKLDNLSEKDFITVLGHIINIKYPENKDVHIDKYIGKMHDEITVNVGYANYDK